VIIAKEGVIGSERIENKEGEKGSDARGKMKAEGGTRF